MAMRVEAEPFTTAAAVEHIEARIAADPDAVPLRFARACALHDLCRTAEAERAYLDVLAHDPTHFGALTNLGTLLHVAGRRDVAQAFYTKALVEHPAEPMAYVNLGNALAEAGSLDEAIATYEGAFAVRPGYPNAHFALALLYRALGRDGEALRHRQLAFAKPIVAASPALGRVDAIDVLLLVAANGGNVVVAPLIDRSAVATNRLVVEGYRDDMALPPHHCVFNAVGDADRAGDALRIAERIVARSGAPCINPPTAVRATTRSDVTTRLAEIAGVVTPRTRAFARDALTPDALAAAGFAFPLLVRSPGYHTGEHFAYVATPDDLAATVATLPGRDLLAIAFLDGRGADGNFRKYRVLFIDGRLYPLHLAIASQWKVHYFSADMALRDEHRREEAAFLDDMPAVLGPRALRALEAVAATLGLDYGGIDFGIGPTGEVLVYEANATMVVLPPPPDDRFAYRHPAVDRALGAAHALVRARAVAGGYAGA